MGQRARGQTARSLPGPGRVAHKPCLERALTSSRTARAASRSGKTAELGRSSTTGCTGGAGTGTTRAQLTCRCASPCSAQSRSHSSPLASASNSPRFGRAGSGQAPSTWRSAPHVSGPARGSCSKKPCRAPAAGSPGLMHCVLQPSFIFYGILKIYISDFAYSSRTTI